MNAEQIRQVRSSWAEVTGRADELATSFYGHLFAIDEAAAALFTHVDMAAQRVKLVQSLAVVVKALDDPDRLMPALGALARRHTGYGVQHRHFTSVGEALLLALGETVGEAFTAELREAWAEAYAIVASVMQRALLRAGVAA